MLTRLVPAALMALGLTLTFQFAAGRAQQLDLERMDAEKVATGQFARTTGQRAESLRIESARIEALAQALLLNAAGESAQETIDALQAFDQGPTVRAVEVRTQFTNELVLREGALATRNLPSVSVGVTRILEGRWAGSYAYRVFDETNSDTSTIIVVDLAAFTESLLGDTSETITVAGIDEAVPLTSIDGSLHAHEDGVFHDHETGGLTAARDVQILGRDARVTVSVADEAIPTSGSREVLYLTFAGILLSIVVAGIAYQGVRRLNRIMRERDVAAAAQRASIARFKASFTHAPIGVVELDHQGRIVVVNPRFASKLGYLPEELEGGDVLDLIDGTDRVAAAERIEEIRDGEADAGQSERRYRTLNGSAMWMRESISVLTADDGNRHVLIQVEDISDERRTRAELHRKALYDELTGLPNRANLVSRLRQAVDLAAESEDKVAVMFVDLNKFKSVNDSLGHEAGDLLLVEVANRLRDECRASDTVARLGGDEFVVILEGVQDGSDARMTADRFSSALNGATEISGTEVEVSASIGLVVADGDVEPEELLRNADQAMYRAKAGDQDEAVVQFDYSMRAATVDRLAQEVALKRAVEDGELELHYQPIVDATSHDVVGLEALVRWHHPSNGLTSPAEFLPLAEELGLLERIDEWTIATGAKALARWSQHATEAADWYLTVNTSASHYLDRGFADRVSDVLVSAGLEPRRLTLERVEGSIYQDEALARATIRQLRSRGVRISLDQFGVGQTALADLASLEVDALKVGRSFIRSASERELHVLRAITELAAGLGLTVVAEGVESQTELDLVRAAGVTFAQGFHFSRPVDAETLAETHGLAIRL